ncbi:MAG TPA: RNA polymerase sigma factor [Anaerolineae bacterium]|jgi:RNA polymerase sigma-70 factor, ECF subfamily|nr:RNA polymerase sigma factor [Anaerolineae bacterium]
MDQDLVVRVQAGDQRAFETLATADYARLQRLAYSVLADPASAEDATQQALLDIWRKVRRLRDPAKYEAWSYRLLVRACYAEARRQSKWMTRVDLASADELRAVDAYGVVADRDQLERGFQRLSMDHRVVIVLRFLLGMSPEDLAATLAIPRWTVYKRLQAATRAMRAALDADARSVAVVAGKQEALR